MKEKKMSEIKNIFLKKKKQKTMYYRESNSQKRINFPFSKNRSEFRYHFSFCTKIKEMTKISKIYVFKIDCNFYLILEKKY